jgi:hypothetical protein
MSAEPSLASRIIAEHCLTTFAVAYYAVNPEKIETRKRVVTECARTLDPILSKIITEAIKATFSNPT